MSGRNPFRELEELFDRMSRSFDDTSMMRMKDISVDVTESDGELVVTADLPGYDKDDIDLAIQERELTIRAEREREEAEEDERYVRRERTHQSLSRTVYLPTVVDEEGTTATYRNGVLTVTLPKEMTDDDDEHRIDIS